MSEGPTGGALCGAVRPEFATKGFDDALTALMLAIDGAGYTGYTAVPALRADAAGIGSTFGTMGGGLLGMGGTFVQSKVRTGGGALAGRSKPVKTGGGAL